MKKIEIGLYGCAMLFLIGMIVSTVTMLVFPLAGIFIEFMLMLFIVCVVLSLILPDIWKDLNGK